MVCNSIFDCLTVKTPNELADFSDRGINFMRLLRQFQARLNFFCKRFIREYIRGLVDRRKGNCRKET